MLNLVPNRFAEPKWQAYVTPDSKAFTFASGRKVKSLYDLKLALNEESEDIIQSCITPNNSIASWVKDAIQDLELADELQKTTHRWGMIVALERHMMRSLSLPYYVAKRWLATTTTPFTFVSGQQSNSLESLVNILQQVSDETIMFHRERVPNDISKLVMDIIGDYQIAEMMEEASSRTQMLHFLEDHVEMLKESSANDLG